jgi:hypothetical protein
VGGVGQRALRRGRAGGWPAEAPSQKAPQAGHGAPSALDPWLPLPPHAPRLQGAQIGPPTRLLARHELERAVRAEVQHGVCLEHLLQVGVVGRKPVVRAGAAAEQQAHRVALVAEGGLHADEHVAKLLAVDEQVVAAAVELAGGLAPVLLQRLAVLAQLGVLAHRHPEAGGWGGWGRGLAGVCVKGWVTDGVEWGLGGKGLI